MNIKLNKKMSVILIITLLTTLLLITSCQKTPKEKIEENKDIAEEDRLDSLKEHSYTGMNNTLTLKYKVPDSWSRAKNTTTFFIGEENIKGFFFIYLLKPKHIESVDGKKFGDFETLERHRKYLEEESSWNILKSEKTDIFNEEGAKFIYTTKEIKIYVSPLIYRYLELVENKTRRDITYKGVIYSTISGEEVKGFLHYGAFSEEDFEKHLPDVKKVYQNLELEVKK